MVHFEAKIIEWQALKWKRNTQHGVWRAVARVLGGAGDSVGIGTAAPIVYNGKSSSEKRPHRPNN